MFGYFFWSSQVTRSSGWWESSPHTVLLLPPRLKSPLGCSGLVSTARNGRGYIKLDLVNVVVIAVVAEDATAYLHEAGTTGKCFEIVISNLVAEQGCVRSTGTWN